uniref:cation diffusion facilitator family transporter n=1 Tax=Psychrobacillus sp. FSL W7-1457 TaxID=2954547 RepID=UPI00406D3492
MIKMDIIERGRGIRIMEHYNNHGQQQSENNNRKVIMWTFLLITSFMIVEVIGGFMTNSLALLSDAGHMLSDSAALGLSYVALIVGQRAVSGQKTFGYRRFEIFAAFINGLTLIAISIYIFYEAVKRFSAPPTVASTGMLIVAVLGLVVNIVAAFILNHGDNENLNVKSAFLHVIGDILGSIGAITAALLILFFQWNIADPIASIIVAVLIIFSGYRVTRDSFHILMEGAPKHLNTDKIEEKILSVKEVIKVTDLHIWSITSDFPSLTCHVSVGQDVDEQVVLRKIQTLLHDEFNVHHMTIQIVK